MSIAFWVGAYIGGGLTAATIAAWAINHAEGDTADTFLVIVFLLWPLGVLFLVGHAPLRLVRWCAKRLP